MNYDLKKWKNIAGFWFIGLANNFLYVVTISGALDIIKERSPPQSLTQSDDFKCSSVGTGALLTVIVVPDVILKFLTPLFLDRISYHYKFIIPFLSAIISILGVVYSQQIWLMMIFVALGGMTVGFGAQAQMSMSSFFHISSLSAYMSGTGGAGIFGSLYYSGLTFYLKPDTVILVSMIFPVIGLLSYFFLLTKPRIRQFSWNFLVFSDEIQDSSETDGLINTNENSGILTTKEKFDAFKSIFWIMVNIFLVYMFEYLINQTFFEVTYFKDTFLTYDQQYRWYQTLYQTGVFIGRTTISIFFVNQIWIFSILQGINACLFVIQIFYHATNQIWLVFLLILYEGTIGGLAYSNSFRKVSNKAPVRIREFAMCICTLGDSGGILIAGILSLPIHKAICDWIQHNN